MALDVEQPEFEHGEDPDRPRADDHDIGFNRLAGKLADLVRHRRAQPWRSGVRIRKPSSAGVTLIWQDSREFGFTS